MFLISAGKIKEKWKKFLLLSMLGVSILLCVCIAFFVKSTAPPDFATSDEREKYSLKAEDIKEQKDFFAQFGYEVDEGSLVSDTVTIPETFNQTYEAYNELQKAVGLDLSRYQGIEVTRNVYKLTKYSKNNGEYYATLLIYKGNVIGGHIGEKVYEAEYFPLK